jgi:hypothetical protein
MKSDVIDWNNIIKKQVRGLNNEDFGEVQYIKDNFIIVERGAINKEKFYFPKDRVESYDGNILKIRLVEFELIDYQDEPFKKDSEKIYS